MPDLQHYRCTVCGWAWGDERPLKQTRCPVEAHHKGLLRARKKRAQTKERGQTVAAGSVLAMALGMDP